MAKDKAPLPTPAPADDKKKAIATAISNIEKLYGKQITELNRTLRNMPNGEEKDEVYASLVEGDKK